MSPYVVLVLHEVFLVHMLNDITAGIFQLFKRNVSDQQRIEISGTLEPSRKFLVSLQNARKIWQIDNLENLLKHKAVFTQSVNVGINTFQLLCSDRVTLRFMVKNGPQTHSKHHC